MLRLFLLALVGTAVGPTIPVGIESSSTLASKEGKYAASNLFDGNPQTAWVEGVPGDGVGENVAIDLGAGAELSGATSLMVEISNGYQKNDAVYENNGVPTKVRVDLLDGAKVVRSKDLSLPVAKVPRVPADNGATVSCTYGAAAFPDLPRMAGAVRIKLTILSVKRGKKWPDTALSEIKTRFADSNPHDAKEYLEGLCQVLPDKSRWPSSVYRDDLARLTSARGYDHPSALQLCAKFLSEGATLHFVRSEKVMDAFHQNDCDGEDGGYQRFFWDGQRWKFVGFAQYRTCNGC